jgi:hypothetical protein
MGSLSSETLTVALAVLFSATIGVIEVPHQSRTTPRDCATWQFAIYLLILAFGNSVTSLLALAFTGKFHVFESPLFVPLWSAVLGVFGFQAVLRNTNVTLFNQGILSLHEWTSKARDNAVASAIASNAHRGLSRIERVAHSLVYIPEADLNSAMFQHLGPESVHDIEEAAARSNADRRLCKAYALAYSKPKESEAILKHTRQFVSRTP